MEHSKEKAVAGVTKGETGLGKTATWIAQHFGVQFRMTSKITHYLRATRFVDEQILGPFKLWWHEHEFFAEGDSTLMIDRIEVEAPFGVLGRIVERLILVRYIERLIRMRNTWLKSELEG